jgi:hypothetical protein
MKRFALLCAFALAAVVAAADEQKFSCFVEHSAGFTTETSAGWSAVGFKPDRRYHLRPATEAERKGKTGLNGRATYFFSSEGTPGDETPCALDAPRKTLRCDGIDAFRMNVETRRFAAFYLHGYIDGVKDKKDPKDKKSQGDNEDTPLVELGLCMPD